MACAFLEACPLNPECSMPSPFRTALALAFAVSPQTGFAQVDSWAVLTGAEDPAIVALAMHCPVYDQAAGRAFCLSVGCTPNEPLSFGFTFAGYDRPMGRDFPATITVDGTEFPPVSMRLIGTGSFETLAAGYVDADHGPLLDALRRGIGLKVRFENEALPPQDMPLNRSMVSIDQAKALCEASDAVPATTIIGQRLDIWEMLSGKADDDHLMDVLEDGTLRVSLNGTASMGTWTTTDTGDMCFDWSGQTGPLCGQPQLRGRNLVMKLRGSDGMLAARIEGTLVGPAPVAP